MANYRKELAQDAVCQSHTGHMTGLWFLPTRPLRLNTNECTCLIMAGFDRKVLGFGNKFPASVNVEPLM